MTSEPSPTAKQTAGRSVVRYGPSASMLFLSVLMGIVLGTGGYTVRYAEGFSYLSSDPRACVNCHIMRDEYDGWQKASHHAVATCNDCHVPHALIPKYMVKAENGLWHSKGFTLQDFHEPIQLRPVSSRILNANCIECHQDFVNDILGHGVAGDQTTGCVHCHASVGHGPRH